MDKQKLLTKYFLLATLSGFFSALVYYISLTTFAKYAAVTYHSSTGMAGLAASIFVLGSIAGRLFSGKYLDLLGRRRLILWGNTLFFLISLTYFLPVPLSVFLSIRFAHGVMFGVVHTVLATVIVDFIPRERLGEGISVFSLNFVIATASGPFVGMFVARNFSYQALFLVMSVSSLLALALVGRVRISEPELSREELAGLKQSSVRDLFEGAALPLSMLILLMSMCYTSVTAFMESYAAEWHLEALSPVFFVVYAAFILAFRPLAGRLLDKKGDNIVMIPALIFYALSLWVLGLAASLPLFLASAVFMALGYGNILNIGQVIAVRSAHHHRLGRATSTYFVFNDAGQGMGPLVMGVIAGRMGFSAMYGLDAALIVAGLAFYYMVHGRHARQRASVVRPAA